ncbi:MAG TPA: PBSX family phage terminase large subunit [Sphingobacteriaceae bacterium]
MKPTIKLPGWGKQVAQSKARYIILTGGRGSAKSTTIARTLILRAYEKKQLILCAREYLAQLNHSVHQLLKDSIEEMGMSNEFRILQNEIICKRNGSRFFYAGLKMNVEGLKSMTNIDHLWIEEAATLSEESWRTILPTIRKEGSQIWVSMNPQNKEDCLYKQFILNDPPPNSLVLKVNWDKNPFFTKENEDLRQIALKGDADMYRHVWEGEPIQHSDSLIFKGKWIVDDFEEPENTYAYYGLDFGFIDPTAAIRCYIINNTLYISHEYYKRQVEINNIGRGCEESIKDFKRSMIICDSAAPGNISFLKKQGYNVKPAVKGKGSVEDLISFLRSFDRMVVHPRCEYMIRELGTYSYKMDARSGDVTPNIIDADNHLIDALRYSVERISKRKGGNYDIVSAW